MKHICEPQFKYMGGGERLFQFLFFKLEIAKTWKRTFQEKKERKKKKNAITPGWVLLSFIELSFNICLVVPRRLSLWAKKKKLDIVKYLFKVKLRKTVGHKISLLYF